MSRPTTSGYYDGTTNKIMPASNSTWDGLSGTTWDAWNIWNYNPATQIVWYAGITDMGPMLNYTLSIETVSTGTVSYQIYTSNTGQFTGEESETIIASGANSVNSFTGRFCLVYVIADKLTDALSISDIKITPSTAGLELTYKDIDSSTLAGTSSSRTLPLTTPVSMIIDMLITPQEVTAYNLDLYVSSTATSTYVIPKIISKSINGPTFALVGIDNQPRNATVDILIKALPSQYMDGNNLKIRQG
jgi:hypothetical protein